MSVRNPISEYPLDTVTMSGSTVYSNGDVIGGLLTFSTQAAQGIINGLVLTDTDNEGAALDLHLFWDTPSTIADNEAFAPTAADLLKYMSKIEIGSSDYETINSMKVALLEQLNYVMYAPKKIIYGYLVNASGGSLTYADTKVLQVLLKVLS